MTIDLFSFAFLFPSYCHSVDLHFVSMVSGGCYQSCLHDFRRSPRFVLSFLDIYSLSTSSFGHYAWSLVFLFFGLFALVKYWRCECLELATCILQGRARYTNGPIHTLTTPISNEKNNNTLTTYILANFPIRYPNVCQKTYTIYRLICLECHNFHIESTIRSLHIEFNNILTHVYLHSMNVK